MGQHKNAAQEKVFVAYMEKNPSLAKFHKGEDRVLLDSMWAELTEELNSHGPPQKNVSTWKKVWQDWKSSVKKKLDHNKKHSRQIARGQYYKLDLSAKEERIAVITGMISDIEDVTDIKPNFEELDESSGSSNSSDSPSTQITETQYIEETCSSKVENAPKRRKIYGRTLNDALAKGLEEHGLLLKSMAESFEESVDTLKSIENNTNDLAEAFKAFNEENRRHHLELEKSRLTALTIKKQKLELEKLRLQLSQKED